MRFSCSTWSRDLMVLSSPKKIHEPGIELVDGDVLVVEATIVPHEPPASSRDQESKGIAGILASPKSTYFIRCRCTGVAR